MTMSRYLIIYLSVEDLSPWSTSTRDSKSWDNFQIIYKIPQQILSPAGIEAEEFYHKVVAISLTHSLMMSGVLISPAEQECCTPKFSLSCFPRFFLILVVTNTWLKKNKIFEDKQGVFDWLWDMVFSISPSEICFFGCHLDKEIQLGSIVQTREHTKERRE